LSRKLQQFILSASSRSQTVHQFYLSSFDEFSIQTSVSFRRRFALVDERYDDELTNLYISLFDIFQAGGSRKDVVIEEKRAVVAKNEETFQAMVFKMTTDDDMPAYSGFEWS
jgi:hypothetical protein